MFELTDAQKEFQQAAKTFGQSEMAPHAAEWDAKKIFPKDVLKKAAEMGFLGVYTSEEMGGLGLGRLDAAIIFEELAACCTSTTAYITIHNMVTGMIDTWGTPELRQEFCTKLAGGEWLGSYCLTEAGSGSDAASLKTKAVKKGSEYVLSGSKVFVSGGGATDVLIVMARTGDESPRGISAFVVPAQTTGIAYGENEKKMGWNSQPTRVISFDEVVIPERYLLGKLGEGFKIALNGLDGGRINIGTCSVGCAQSALAASTKYMNERKQFGKSLNQFQALQFKVADLFTELIAARQMVRLAAWKYDHKDPQTTVYCAMAKRFATDVGFKVCNEAIQLHGGYGYTQDYPVERNMRDSRVHQILEGTNEVMRLIISRKVLEDGMADTFK